MGTLLQGYSQIVSIEQVTPTVFTNLMKSWIVDEDVNLKRNHDKDKLIVMAEVHNV